MTKCSQDFTQEFKCYSAIAFFPDDCERWTTACLGVFKNKLLKGDIRLLLRPFVAIKPDTEKQEDLFLKVNALSFIPSNSTGLYCLEEPLWGVPQSYFARNRKAEFTAAVGISPSLHAVESFVLMRTYLGIYLPLYRDVFCFLGRITCATCQVFTMGG